MPKISLIIPVYNVAQYLPQCLESILEQSLKDIEIICVNDGSTDNSLEILQEFADRDNRVKIIDQKNGGRGVARNNAIDKAIGEYIFFCDSDDWLGDKNALETAYNQAIEQNLDLLIFGGWSCDGEKRRHGGYSYTKLPKKYLGKVFGAQDIKNSVFKFPATPWTKLYKREFLIKNGIKFQEIMVGEDQLLFFHSMIAAQRIALLPQNLYCYRKNRVGSAMSVKKKIDFSPIYVFEGIEKLLQEKGLMSGYETIFVNKYFSKAVSWLGKFSNEAKKEYFAEFSKLLQHIKTTYPNSRWTSFNPGVNDSYWVLKFKILMLK